MASASREKQTKESRAVRDAEQPLLEQNQRLDGPADIVPQDQTDMQEPPAAPDGGYAWWVLVGSFVCNLLVDGVVFAFGGIYEHLKLHFHASATEASLVGSLLCGCYLLMGALFFLPLLSCVPDKLFLKPVKIVILFAVSFSCSRRRDA